MFDRVYRCLLGFAMYCMAWQGSGGVNRDSQVFIRFGRVLQGFMGVRTLTCVWGVCRVWVGFGEICRTVMGFSWVCWVSVAFAGVQWGFTVV